MRPFICNYSPISAFTSSNTCSIFRSFRFSTSNILSHVAELISTPISNVWQTFGFSNFLIRISIDNFLLGAEYGYSATVSSFPSPKKLSNQACFFFGSIFGWEMSSELKLFNGGILYQGNCKSTTNASILS